jgi:DNA replication and repair protein RecF
MSSPSPTPLVLTRLVASEVRNLVRVELEPARRLTVLHGDNGQGKTSILEAIYLAATSKSFRTAKLGELVRHGAAVAHVKASFVEGDGGVPRDQMVAIDEGRRVVKLDGKRPPSLAAYATRSPVVCFHARELELSTGAAGARRTVLDRVALFVDPSAAEHAARYREALRSRQKALSLRGPNATDVPPFEALCASHGAALTRCRARAAEALVSTLIPTFRSLAAPGLDLVAAYQPGGTDDVEAFRRELASRREKDRVRGAATFGPHRDDLGLTLDGHLAREVASQGQHRTITLALKLAELAAISRARGLFPVLLLDDVSSELDRDRMAALLAYLGDTQGQIFVTTTRPELIVTPGLAAPDRRDLRVVAGAIVAP